MATIGTNIAAVSAANYLTANNSALTASNSETLIRLDDWPTRSKMPPVLPSPVTCKPGLIASMPPSRAFRTLFRTDKPSTGFSPPWRASPLPV